MKKTEIQFTTNWERRMKRGRLKYGLIEGSIFGIFVYLFSVLGSLLLSDYVFDSTLFIFELMFWILGGIGAYLTVMWRLNMYFYTRYQKKYSLIQGQATSEK